MKVIAQKIEQFFNWIWNSSADANQVSLTVKSVGLGLIPPIIHFVTLSCGLGILCLAVDTPTLTSVVNTIGDVIFYGLSAVASIGFVIGFIRKIYLTATGKIANNSTAGQGAA